jgi:hypothetical protein
MVYPCFGTTAKTCGGSIGADIGGDAWVLDDPMREPCLDGVDPIYGINRSERL